VSEVKHSACELIRQQKSGPAADTDEDKTASAVKRHGPATWPGISVYSFTLYLVIILSFNIMERLNENDIALLNKSPHSHGASLAKWDHTVLPVTRHK